MGNDREVNESLDNLENSLKSLESREEGGSLREREVRQREAEKAMALASAAYAEQLRKGEFTAELLRHVTRISHGMRMKVHMAWIGTTLRLEARSRLELRPMPDGVVAAFLENQSEVKLAPVDLSAGAEAWHASGVRG